MGNTPNSRDLAPDDPVEPPGTSPRSERPGSDPLDSSQLDPERYVGECELGRGGMGKVDRVLDRVLARRVALKRLLPNATPVQSRRFVEEARITGKLDHPNIVPVYDLGLRGSEVVFTMKEVSGDTLKREIVQLHADGLEPRALERILRIFLKVCDAMAFAHSRGVIHRDLKPTNILVGSHGQVFVMDWGLALDLHSQASLRRTGVCGTPAYMAPEQALGNVAEIDGRTDVFGLGAILYEIVAGWPPNQANTVDEALKLAREERSRDPRTSLPPNQLAPDGLCDIVTRALASRREDRYASVDDLRAEVEGFLRGGGWFATKRFAPGELIMREGDDADFGYILVTGECEVYHERDGVHHTLRKLGPGDVFGETAIFSSAPRTASVRAIDQVTTKVVTTHALHHELDMDSWLGTFVRQLTSRFVEIDQKLRERGRDLL